jgi:hypothetical protein
MPLWVHRAGRSVRNLCRAPLPMVLTKPSLKLAGRHRCVFEQQLIVPHVVFRHAQAPLPRTIRLSTSIASLVVCHSYRLARSVEVSDAVGRRRATSGFYDLAMRCPARLSRKSDHSTTARLRTFQTKALTNVSLYEPVRSKMASDASGADGRGQLIIFGYDLSTG